jgi:Major Facilitator Superfamily
VGTEISPTIGGILYGKTGYIGVFGVGIAVIVVDLIMRLFVIEKKTAAKYIKSTAISVEQQGNGNPSDHDRNREPNSASERTALLKDGTTPHQDPASHQQDVNTYILPSSPSNWLTRKMPILTIIHNPSLLASLFTGHVQALLIASFDSTIPTVSAAYFSFDSFQTGLLFFALGGPFFAFGPIAGWWVDRWGTKWPATIGFLGLVPVLVCLRFVSPSPEDGEGGATMIALYAVLLVLAGIGITAVGAPGIVEAGAVVERYYKANRAYFGEQGPYAQLYGLNSMVVSAGYAFGPMIAGTLKETIGYGNMNAVMAGISLVTGVLSWLYVG